MKEIKIKTTNPDAANEILEPMGIIMKHNGEYQLDEDGNYNTLALSNPVFAKEQAEEKGYDFEVII